MIQQVSLERQVVAILEQDYRGIQKPLSFNEIEELLRFRLGYWVDTTALNEIIEEMEAAGSLIYAIMPDHKIAHLPASAERELPKGTAYWLGQRGKVTI